MRDLTEQLSNDIAKAINTYRTKAEDRQREAEEAQIELNEAIEAAHRTFELASTLRVEQAHKDMVAQVTTFLGQPKLQERPPDVAEGPSVTLITDSGFDNGEAVK